MTSKDKPLPPGKAEDVFEVFIDPRVLRNARFTPLLTPEERARIVALTSGKANNAK